MHAKQEVASDSGEGNHLSRNDVIVKACELHLIGFADNGVPIPILTEEQGVPFILDDRSENRVAASGNGGLFRHRTPNDGTHVAGVQRAVCAGIDAVFIAIRIEADDAVLRRGVGRRPALNLFELVVFDLVKLREGLVVRIFLLEIVLADGQRAAELFFQIAQAADAAPLHQRTHLLRQIGDFLIFAVQRRIHIRAEYRADMVGLDFLPICLQAVDFRLVVAGRIDLADHAGAADMAAFRRDKINARLIFGFIQPFVAGDDNRARIRITHRSGNRARCRRL